MKKRADKKIKNKVGNKLNTKVAEEKKYFLFGIFLFFALELIFMPEGIYFEKILKLPMTGIPSAIGLTLGLIIGILLFKKTEKILLGYFSFAIFSPILLIIMALFGVKILTPYFYLSLSYLIIMILIVLGFFYSDIFRKIFGKK